MVCIRCKMVVKEELAKLGVKYLTVDLGETELQDTITPEQHDQLKVALLKSGLELMDDKKGVLIQKIKNVIIELVHYSEEPLVIKFSEYLSQKLEHDYTYLANLFSEVQDHFYKCRLNLRASGNDTCQVCLIIAANVTNDY